MSDNFWRRCSNCKKELGFGITYWVCNVSTCNAKRTGLVFCSVDCWDAHLPVARHKDAWAEERRSPAQAEAQDEQSPQAEGRRVVMEARRAEAPVTASPKHNLSPAPPEEILVVASKVKAYITARSGLSVSARVMDVLSDHIRRLCDDAVRTALRNERKTVLDRDVAARR